MRILFIGDIVGKPGRTLVRRGVGALAALHDAECVIANIENAAGGFGVTREVGDEILDAGVHVMTSGNHVWDKKEALTYIVDEPRFLRPTNYPTGAPGRGSFLFKSPSGPSVGVVNVMGRVFMTPIDDPFVAARRELDALRARTPVLLVDFHAEATSEKIAMGWHLDGLATAVVGTHTHVQTADERVLPRGTAYITDVGMTGPHDGVIGVERDAALGRFLTALPARFDTAAGDARLHAVLITARPDGLASAIERISLTMDQIRSLAAGAEIDDPAADAERVP
jgi:metallophosphoesterase (TIGR00282 family)